MGIRKSQKKPYFDKMVLKKSQKEAYFEIDLTTLFLVFLFIKPVKLRSIHM